MLTQLRTQQHDMFAESPGTCCKVRLQYAEVLQKLFLILIHSSNELRVPTCLSNLQKDDFIVYDWYNCLQLHSPLHAAVPFCHSSFLRCVFTSLVLFSYFLSCFCPKKEKKNQAWQHSSKKKAGGETSDHRSHFLTSLPLRHVLMNLYFRIILQSSLHLWKYVKINTWNWSSDATCSQSVWTYITSETRSSTAHLKPWGKRVFSQTSPVFFVSFAPR